MLCALLRLFQIVVVNSVIGLQLFIVSVQSRSMIHAPLDRSGVISGLPELVRLLKTVWQVLWVEGVPLLIWLVNS